MGDRKMVVVHIAPSLKWSIVEKQYVAAGPCRAILFVVCVCQNILVVLVVLVLNVRYVCFPPCLLLAQELSQLLSSVVK